MLICQIVESEDLRGIVIRVDDSEFLRRFTRIYDGPMMDSSSLCRFKNAIQAYGFGCPGSGGFLPHLSASGCPSPGDRMTLSLDRGPGGSAAVLAFGLTRAALELQDGCMLRVTPLLGFGPPIPLSGTGPGNGAFSLNVRLPASAASGAVTLQALVLDAATSRGWTTSNGVEITIR